MEKLEGWASVLDSETPFIFRDLLLELTKTLWLDRFFQPIDYVASTTLEKLKFSRECYYLRIEVEKFRSVTN